MLQSMRSQVHISLNSYCASITETCLYSFDPPYTPLLYSKTGVYRDIHFLISVQKHRDTR